MSKITVSAPGKLMLFGEHAVLYGRPCLVTAVDQRMWGTVELIDEPIFQLDAPDVSVEDYKKPMSRLGAGDIPKGAKFVEVALYNFYNRYKSYIRASGIRVTTTSRFSSQFGFGSSSASTVCVIKALSELTKKKLTNQDIFKLAFKTVLDIQGKGSGFDVAVATFGGTLYFVTGGKLIQPLKTFNLPLIVGYSGIKADTANLINEVSKKAQKFPRLIDGIYKSIGNIVEEAQKALLKKDWETLGELMNLNQGYLAALGVGSKILANMIYGAREAGAYGAKLSGAGVGDCIIALAPSSKKKAVSEAINNAGGQVIDVEANVEGVTLEA